MNGQNKYLQVGIFVLVGVALLIALTLWFAGEQTIEPKERYTLQFNRDISGLSIAAPVRYLGVDVGEVIDMKLDPANGTSVQVDLEVLRSTPINSATYGSLSFQGVTGVAFISLAADPVENPAPIQKLDGYKYPVIPSRDTGLSAILSSGPEITGRLTVLLDRANELLDDKNKSAISNSLTNIETITASLANEEKTIANLPNQLNMILKEVDKTVKQLQGSIKKAEPDFVQSMQRLNRATASLEKVTARLDNWGVEHEEDLEKFITAGLAQTPDLISDTRIAVRELEKLVSELRKNPSQIIYQPQSEPLVVEP